MGNTPNISEIVENCPFEVSKKVWIAPVFEIISKENIKSGGVKAGVEGTPSYSLVS